MNDVPGYSELAAYCGGEFPSFHDAEILSLTLNRAGVSSLVIQLIRRPPHKSFPITLFLEDVYDLELADFSHQNVIFGLSLTATLEGIEIRLSPSFGLAGWIRAKQVKIEFQASELTSSPQ